MIDLPQGWSFEPMPTRPINVITAVDSKGMVSVDYGARKFRGGYSALRGHFDLPADEDIRGRGWQGRLEALAVEWLAEAIKPIAPGQGR